MWSNEAAVAAFLGGVALKSAAVLAVAWAGAWMLRKRSAAARHAVWMAAFAALLALPVLSLALPALRLRWSAAWIPDASTLVYRASAAGAAASAAPGATAVAALSLPGRSGGKQIDWAGWAMLAWAVGSAALLAQMALAYLGMARKRRRARPFERLRDLPVQTLEAERGWMPMTFGIARPAIFLPAEAREWSEERLDLVVRHELAHIERGDAATHLVARAALSLAWWNPLAWKAWREFIKEREKAADDLVLSGGARASDYAGHLLEIARSMQPERAMGWAAVAMARRSHLEGRVLSILDAKTRRGGARKAGLLSAFVAAAALCAPLAAVQAQSAQTALPADVDATIRAARAQRNFAQLDAAAREFEKARNFDVARKLLDSSLEIRTSVAGERSGEYAAGLVNLGDLEAKRSRRDDALGFYRKAVDLGDKPEIAPALIYLGIAALGSKDVPGAMGYFQRAAAVGSGPEAARANMWIALTEEQSPNVAAAQTEADFRKAIAGLDANSSDMATALDLFAFFLEKQGRDDEAKPLRQQASAIIGNLQRADRASVAASGKAAATVNAATTRPELIQKVEPAYSEEARAAKYQGTVVLGVVIGTDGTASQMRVVKSLGLGLDEKAIEAVQQWRFKPATKNGAPLAVQAVIEVNFKLL